MLVVSADDLGLSEGVDRAIVAAHRGGIVRSTSLLVTFPRSAEAAALARGEPDLEVGLHIDLVEGAPVSDPARVRTLVNGDGRFRGMTDLFAGVATGRVRASEIATEVRAQVESARALGTPALAWDSHRHVHLFPLVARVVGALGRELGARWIRRAAPPARPLSFSTWLVPPRALGPAWKADLLHFATLGSRPFFRGIPGSDWYLDLTSERRASDPVWVALLATLPGVGEVSAHPGTAATAGDPFAERRPKDLALLTDPLLRSALGRDMVRWRVP